MENYCGCDCTQCSERNDCKGCKETCGNVFGHGVCPLARCCIENKQECSGCSACVLKEKLLGEINTLIIPGMPRVTELYVLRGSIINLAYPLPGGGSAQFWCDDALYFGTQVPGEGGLCFGIGADDAYILVSTYGENGADPEIVCFVKRPKD